MRKRTLHLLIIFFPVLVEEVGYERTVQTSTCELLVLNRKCAACKEYQSTLRYLSSQKKQRESITPTKQISVSSRVNFRYLSTLEKAEQYANFSTKAKLASKEVERLK